MRSVQAAWALESDESPLQRYLQEVKEHRREGGEVECDEHALVVASLTDSVTQGRCASSAPPAQQAGRGAARFERWDEEGKLMSLAKYRATLQSAGKPNLE